MCQRFEKLLLPKNQLGQQIYFQEHFYLLVASNVDSEFSTAKWKLLLKSLALSRLYDYGCRGGKSLSKRNFNVIPCSSQLVAPKAQLWWQKHRKGMERDPHSQVSHSALPGLHPARFQFSLKTFLKLHETCFLFLLLPFH